VLGREDWVVVLPEDAATLEGGAEGALPCPGDRMPGLLLLPPL
jgi:hypothetical protein